MYDLIYKNLNQKKSLAPMCEKSVKILSKFFMIYFRPNIR